MTPEQVARARNKARRIHDEMEKLTEVDDDEVARLARNTRSIAALAAAFTPDHDVAHLLSMVENNRAEVFRLIARYGIDYKVHQTSGLENSRKQAIKSKQYKAEIWKNEATPIAKEIFERNTSLSANSAAKIIRPRLQQRLEKMRSEATDPDTDIPDAPKDRQLRDFLKGFK
jgi:hypothetical protein